jgi:hypothetical protein
LEAQLALGEKFRDDLEGDDAAFAKNADALLHLCREGAFHGVEFDALVLDQDGLGLDDPDIVECFFDHAEWSVLSTGYLEVALDFYKPHFCGGLLRASPVATVFPIR